MIIFKYTILIIRLLRLINFRTLQEKFFLFKEYFENNWLIAWISFLIKNLKSVSFTSYEKPPNVKYYISGFPNLFPRGIFSIKICCF